MYARVERIVTTRHRQLDAFAQYLVVEKGLAANTVAAYMADLQRFCDAAESAPLRRETIASYLQARRQDGLTARSAARELSAIKAFCRFLHERGALQGDPSHNMRMPHLPQRLPSVLTHQEVEDLLQAPERRCSRADPQT